MTTDTNARKRDIDRVLEAVQKGHQTSATIAKEVKLGQDATCVHLLALKTQGKVTRDESGGRPYKYKPASAP